jgi:hypothetical protein
LYFLAGRASAARSRHQPIMFFYVYVYVHCMFFYNVARGPLAQAVPDARAYRIAALLEMRPPSRTLGFIP